MKATNVKCMLAQWNEIEAIRGRGLEANDGMMIPTVN